MQNKKKPAGKTTQSFLRLSEIKNDTVVVDDGTLRAILTVSSTNFDLKSQDEQDSIIFNFQRFLNSLDFFRANFNAKPQNGNRRLFWKS